MEAQKQPEGKQSVDANLYLETVSGQLVDPINPKAEDMRVEDIAWALSRIPRFAGHTTSTVPYSVAEHSVHVSLLVEKMSIETWNISEDEGSITNLCMYALFHDAHEAFTGDIPSPIKRLPELRPILKTIEHRLDRAIMGMCGCVKPLPEKQLAIVKHCDLLALAIEAQHFIKSKGSNWNLPIPSEEQMSTFNSNPLLSKDAYDLFIARFNHLMGTI